LHHSFSSLEGAYLNFTDEAFGSSLYSVCLLDFCNLLVASLVIPTWTLDINMLAPITRMPLDLFHLLVGACLGLFISCAPSHHSGRSHWAFSPVRDVEWHHRLVGRLLHASRGGSSGHLLWCAARWGAPASTSSLVEEVAGCIGACSMMGGSNGFELPIALGSTSEAALQFFH
jgi:hypothetical protein